MVKHDAVQVIVSKWVYSRITIFLLVLTRAVYLSILAHSSCFFFFCLVFPWLRFDMRFTRQFSVYYCCVQVVPDKIIQCLWIIAAWHLRRWSVARLVYPGLFTGAGPCSCFINSILQKLALTSYTGLLWLHACSVLILALSQTCTVFVYVPVTGSLPQKCFPLIDLGDQCAQGKELSSFCCLVF